MQSITRRLLALWQEQMSLMSQDAETLGYGEAMFKAMGMPVPDAARQDAKPTPKAETATTPAAGAEETSRPSSDELSSEQHATMVDELTRRINELAGQIAKYEANTISSNTERKS
ncbi:hypothetical protein [Curvivirga sp.]|uniref:hypothetical protein n=1 Tax=Curvivirga sp. TaxID=2856848 RepID=UPI003B58DF2F